MNSTSGQIKLWSTDIKVINFSKENKKNHFSLFKKRDSEKENSLNQSNKKNFWFSNEKKSKNFRFVNDNKHLSKSIDKNINFPNIKDFAIGISNNPNKMRNNTPKDFNIDTKYLRKSANFIQSQSKTSYENFLKPVENDFEKKKTLGDAIKRTICTTHLKERVNRIDEVSAECESSILNMKKFINEELKLSSLFIDEENSEKSLQNELIQDVLNFFYSFNMIFLAIK